MGETCSQNKKNFGASLQFGGLCSLWSTQFSSIFIFPFDFNSGTFQMQPKSSSSRWCCCCCCATCCFVVHPKLAPTGHKSLGRVQKETFGRFHVFTSEFISNLPRIQMAVIRSPPFICCSFKVHVNDTMKVPLRVQKLQGHNLWNVSIVSKIEIEFF